MTKMFFNPYHFVTVSPWPLLTSFGGMMMVMGFVSWFFFMQMSLFLISIFLMFLMTFQWWRDVVREVEYQGSHSVLVVNMIQMGFVMFILSELFFFVSFFWSYFHMLLSPPLEGGGVWPPQGIIPFDALGIPMINSLILITSGMTITVSHHLLMVDSMKKSMYLLLTICLGLIFTLFQGIEYYYSSFTMSDSVYGSLFFIMTGFHGLHVIIGSIFLLYCYNRMIHKHFMSFHHVGFEAACWYWHFVDVVWLFLFIIVYWLSS